MQEKLIFYYTNDLHSNFSHWPQVINYFNARKKSQKARDNSYWTVDIGDHMDRVHPISEAFMGRANVTLMNHAGYDIVTIGNNEGITLSEDDFQHLYDDADFNIVCANLSKSKGVNPNWLQSHAQVTSKTGVKIGVIGLTAEFNAFYHMLHWHAEDALVALGREIHQIKDSVDVIILLSHLGWEADRKIARLFPDIDVIIGGHTHHLLQTGEYVEDTLITAGGKLCTHVGEVILTWDHKHKELIHKEAHTTNITHRDKDQATAELLAELNDKAEKKLSKTITYLKEPIIIDWFTSSDLMVELTKTLQIWTDVDCAMLNTGLLLDSLSAGDITYQDVHRICPHPINPCVVELTGAELLEVIRASQTKDLTELELDGYGFRGKVIGKMIFSNIDILDISSQGGQIYPHNVQLNNHPLELDAIYSVATADVFTFGRLLPEVAKSKIKHYFLPEFIRDLLAETLKKYNKDN